MNAVKPPVRACSSRTRNRCSIRSALDSPRPYIIVTEVFMPCRCASSWTPSHSSVCAFFLATRSRISSTRISPPPPGMLSSPASRSSRTTSDTGSPKRSLKKTTSLGEKPWMWIGWLRLM